MKRTLLLAGLLVGLLHSSIASAQDARTDWVPIAKSLTALLNEGWRINSCTQSNSANMTYTFVLSKENKFVICLIVTPEPNNAASRCRTLN